MRLPTCFLYHNEHMNQQHHESEYDTGVDELNIAEFPLCTLTNRIDPSVKTLYFEDQIFDKSSGEMVTRKLTITSSDEWGLPTPSDTDVVLGLMQLSNWTGQDVYFNRHQFVRLVGWDASGQNYKRLENSILRLVGVTFYYKNAWWDTEEKKWVDKSFHFLSGHSRDPDTDEFKVRWDKEAFELLKNQYFKKINLELFRQLKIPAAKRMYRFLDKRFYHGKHFSIELKKFAFEKIGLSRKYSPSGLKQALKPALTELEKSGYLKPLPVKERYEKIRKGEWRIQFEKGEGKPPEDTGETTLKPSETPSPDVQTASSILDTLIEYGVSQKHARCLIKRHREEDIRLQIEHVQFLIDKGKPPEDSGAFLTSAITQGYEPPKDFKTQAQMEQERTQAQKKKEAAQARKEAQQKAEAQREAAEKAEEEREEKLAASYLRSLPETMREEVIARAIASGSDIERQIIERKSPGAQAIQDFLVKKYVLGLLEC